MAIGGVESTSRHGLPSTPVYRMRGAMIVARCSSHAPHTDLARGFSEVLAVEVLERLACLEWVSAEQPRSPAEVSRIRARLTEAIAAWRRLLDKHRADEHDRCPAVTHVVRAAASQGSVPDMDHRAQPPDHQPNGEAPMEWFAASRRRPTGGTGRRHPGRPFPP